MNEIKGIDVSANQGNINWKTVANYGMGFAILRITEKGNVIDPTFERNYKGCIDNKIPVGVYKYSYATSIEQIKTEASIVIKTLNKRKLDYPVFLDIEDKCQRNISKNIMMQMINAFRAIIVKAGYKFGIYCKHNGVFTHTGLVIKVQGDKFWTIEGNTSGASGIVANGGGVCQKSYYNSQLPGTKFCRPDYSIVTSIKSGSSTNTSTTTTTKNWIEYGDRGNDVKTLQTKLNKVGYKLEVNGICGNATVTAIKDFQTKYNLTVDGQAGKNTITKLDSVIAAKENKNFKAFVGACTTNSTPVYQKATGATALATYPILNRGNLVDVVGVSGSRYKIKIANAYTGYIDKNKITTPDKLTTKYPHGVCTGNDVAVRKGAGKSYDKISGYPTLNKDNEVDILGSKKDSSGNVWKKVRIAGKHIGYVFGKYIKQD